VPHVVSEGLIIPDPRRREEKSIKGGVTKCHRYAFVIDIAQQKLAWESRYVSIIHLRPEFEQSVFRFIGHNSIKKLDFIRALCLEILKAAMVSTQSSSELVIDCI